MKWTRLVGVAAGLGMYAGAGIAEPVVVELETAIETAAAAAYLGIGLLVELELIPEQLGVQKETDGIICASVAFAYIVEWM